MVTKRVVVGSIVVCTVALIATTSYAQKKAEDEVEQAHAKRAAITGEIGKGNRTKAMQDLKDVVKNVKERDTREWATIELWNMAQKDGKLDEVVTDLEAAAAKNPKDIELQRAVAEGHLRKRDFNKVTQIYENLTKEQPGDPVLETRLTDYYILSKQYDKAIARLEPIVNANPNDDYHSDILMNAYVQAKAEGKALTLFKKRLDKEPNSPGLRARYGQALQDFGRLDEAIKEWEKAAQLDPSNGFFMLRANELKAQVEAGKKR